MDILDAYKSAVKAFEKSAFSYVLAVGVYFTLVVFLSIPIFVLFSLKMLLKKWGGAISLAGIGYGIVMMLALVILLGGVLSFIHNQLRGKSPKTISIILGSHIKPFFGLSIIAYFIYVLCGFLPGQLAKGISVLNIAFLLPILLVLVAVFLLMFTPFIIIAENEDVVYAAPHSASFVLGHLKDVGSYAVITIIVTIALFLFPVIGWGLWCTIFMPISIIAGFNIYRSSMYSTFSQQQKLRF